MSRIGKIPVTIPQDVTVDLAGGFLTTKGKLGTLRLAVNNDVDTVVKDGKVVITPKSETKRARMAWGTMRALVNNMVNGVSKGYTVNLDINGVGYRAAVRTSRSPAKSRRRSRSRARTVSASARSPR